MSIIEDQYNVVPPQLKYLKDEVVLAQAWKKAHSYIRRHNWYADTLELDLSTINLEDNLKKWVKSVTKRPNSMSLVLAPKNAEWHFEEDDETNKDSLWKPVESQKLRALAHLSLKDQTISTAVMLCLANAVESAQGPSTESDFFLAQDKKIYSYGNRLHCDWIKTINFREIAQFGWGNSLCYRQFYEDYQQFLKRPRVICQYLERNLNPKRKLYVVSLDIQRFYDCIDRDILIKELEILHKEYLEEYNLEEKYQSDDKFWSNLETLFNWNWDINDRKLKEYLNDSENTNEQTSELPQGIPQGLVAGGFFANAYLVNFDRTMGELINSKNDNFIVRDYCRYVDDIRLVIEVEEENNLETEYKNLVSNFVNNKIKDYFQKKYNSNSKLIINPIKTKINSYENISSQNDISVRMNMIQGVISGTPDIEALEHAIGGLDSLLHLSEKLFEEDKTKQTKKINKSLDLFYISVPNVDVKNDTLKRFAAARLVKALKMKRTMTDLEEPIYQKSNFSNIVTKGNLLDHEFETTARKFIALWSRNPSLSLLLKFGLEIYPDSKLLKPVLDAMYYKLFDFKSTDLKDRIDKKAIEYIAADLLYTGAIRIGYKNESSYPSKVNIAMFREELATLAERVLKDKNEFPWYLQQQASLFLASIEKYINLNGYSPKLEHYKSLHEALQYNSNLSLFRKPFKINDYVIVSLIAQQIHPNKERYSTWFSNIWSSNEIINKEKIASIILLNRPDIFVQILSTQNTIKEEIKNTLPEDILLASEDKNRTLKLKNDVEIRLSDLIRSENNPFQQENALLLLAKSFLESEYFGIKYDYRAPISVNDITIRCKDWSKIQSLNSEKDFLSVNIKKSSVSIINEKPKWVNSNSFWIYNIGQLLRSCLTGEFDFTTHSFLARNNSESYKGLRSTWFSRRFGMLNNSKSLFEDPLPLSPWISELLLILLQWPGINYHEKEIKQKTNILSKFELLQLIGKRIESQKKIWGHLSQTPMYTMPVSNKKTINDPLFRVIVVQTLVPRFEDFDEKDPLYWTSSFRAKHRSHIASICNLISQHLTASKTVILDRREDRNVDLIIFPELSIHEDDLDLIRGLSDSTGASIFAGTTFTKRSYHDNAINQAVWVLRSEKRNGREFNYVWQGKKHMTAAESALKIEGYRPYQLLIDFEKANMDPIRVAGSICYDSTDLSLVADLRDISDVFVIVALNQDVDTFDNMVSALHYHMYQPVILVNTGEFGGSTVKAPFTKYNKTITQIHGNNQLAISVFELDPSIFRSIKKPKKVKEVKTPPAGYKGRS
ncbi:RNA-directed DNA polymerase [Paenibacillus bovis]|uniref:Reverse transcriptase domain-containing protein n=1 Tax=Paenibacillus bovis TaxID=1616788 RepID=A0A172ZBB1_9BACL|nr:RNA-directed DNA polymerase [Paenibacillus bovis]ANF94809.1 hypothetical protein AR543_01345 [Paenibacillus bovis]